MAGAEVIGAAIGVLLLILVGYLVVGSTLTSADIITTAQKDVTLQNEIRLRTEIAIPVPTPASPQFKFKVKNTGSEPVGDFAHWDVFVNTSTGYQRYNYDNSGNLPGLWIIENNPHLLNPDKEVWICATINGDNPDKVLVITANGVYTLAQF